MFNYELGPNADCIYELDGPHIAVGVDGLAPSRYGNSVSGQISNVSGYVSITDNAHGLRIGQVISLTGHPQRVTSVISANQFLTNAGFTASGTGTYAVATPHVVEELYYSNGARQIELEAVHDIRATRYADMESDTATQPSNLRLGLKNQVTFRRQNGVYRREN